MARRRIYNVLTGIIAVVLSLRQEAVERSCIVGIHAYDLPPGIDLKSLRAGASRKIRGVENAPAQQKTMCAEVDIGKAAHYLLQSVQAKGPGPFYGRRDLDAMKDPISQEKTLEKAKTVCGESDDAPAIIDGGQLRVRNENAVVIVNKGIWIIDLGEITILEQIAVNAPVRILKQAHDLPAIVDSLRNIENRAGKIQG